MRSNDTTDVREGSAATTKLTSMTTNITSRGLVAPRK